MPKKKPGSVHTAKNGAKYKIMPNGRARFISGPTKGRGAKKKGGSVRVGGGLSLSSVTRAGTRIAKKMGVAKRARNMVKRSGIGSAVRSGVRSAVRSARSAPSAARSAARGIVSGARKSIRSAPGQARKAARGFVRGTIRDARGGAKAANYALGGSVRVGGGVKRKRRRT